MKKYIVYYEFVLEAEDICPHGVGHCNDIHGCDGCCEGLYK